MYQSVSYKLYREYKHFFSNLFFWPFFYDKKNIAIGWGYKRSGLRAKKSAEYILIEDGFIRSIGLGVKGWPSFSIVEDDIGIYYDATAPSRLENILNSYDFQNDEKLIQTAKKAIELIKKHKISKYNHFSLKLPEYLKTGTKKVLIVAQTKGDLSLKYGYAQNFDTNEMVVEAIKENPDSEIYLKVHPDVLAGKKKSNIDIDFAKKYCKIISEDINPLVLLEKFEKVYTQTSQMGFEALLLGKKVICFGMPFYAGWGLTVDKIVCKRRKRKLSVEEIFAGAYILYARYYNPYTRKKSNIIDTILTIKKYRDIYSKNDGKLYFFGFSRWKRGFVKPFFKPLNSNRLTFCNSLEEAIQKGLDSDSKIFIWGKKRFDDIEKHAKEKNISLYRVEDGFVRSVTLGSDLTRAYSLVVDSRGIYFDPTQKSDLEHILNTFEFDQELIQRAKKLREYITAKKISKYNIYQDIELKPKDLNKGQKIVFVPGQVEDDASIVFGAGGMKNIELLQKIREKARDAYIIYKPHPDVLVGNRVGDIKDKEALKYCNLIVKEASVDSVLSVADEVHTMTSLVGFEALLRGKKVYTYGMPFYAGWGLTVDSIKNPRRIRKRSLQELIAAAYIVYPRYIQPKTKEFCEIEVLLDELDKAKKRYNSNYIFKTLIDGRNFISRKIQFFIKVFIGE